MDICIVGGGHLGTTIAGELAHNFPDYNISLLTSQPTIWDGIIKVNDIEMNKTYEGKINAISSSPIGTIDKADVVFITVPSFMVEKTLIQIDEYLKPGCYVGIIPGSGGCEFYWRETKSKDTCTFFGLGRVPYTCKYQVYGKETNLKSRKKQLFAAAIPSDKSKEVCRMLELLFRIPCVEAANYLNITLTPTNPVLHTSRTYGIFSKKEKGEIFTEKIKFYAGWTDDDSRMIFGVDSELQKLCKMLNRINLSEVVSLPEYYESCTPEQLTEKIHSIETFKSVYAPLLPCDNGFIPDENSRMFIEKKDFMYSEVNNYYKTVNIYKFSKEFSNKQYIPFLSAYIKAYGKNRYYELVLKAIAHLSSANLKAYDIGNTPWYEIDDAQDLHIANTIFAQDEDRLHAYEFHFGGYWRFTDLKDYCYLVNPYYPSQKMVDHFKYFFDTLLRAYPSGMNNQRLAAGKMFNIDERYLLVGNGAAELINVLGRVIKGTVGISLPAFNEYIRCFPECDIKPIYSKEDRFTLNKKRLIQISKSCDAIFVINPDNPSGSFLKEKDLLDIVSECKKNNTICVVDESFIDFADSNQRYTLLRDDIISEYPNMIVIKSISKSYGVPGLRLGILATSNEEILVTLRKYLPIWNINSFAEYFLQIYGCYEKEYGESCDKIAEQRKKLIEKLQGISFLKIYDSQANYLMCEVIADFSSKDLAGRLLKEYNLLIKDLSDKDGFYGKDFIRIAVKDEQENCILWKALLEIDKGLK